MDEPTADDLLADAIGYVALNVLERLADDAGARRAFLEGLLRLAEDAAAEGGDGAESGSRDGATAERLEVRRTTGSGRPQRGASSPYRSLSGARLRLRAIRERCNADLWSPALSFEREL
jgi:hypothetical protein